MEKTISIIGGGASGMIASIFAAKSNSKVILWEKKQDLGKKILVTGNGRCNFTNKDLRLSHFHCRDKNFIKPALDAFDNKASVDFFNSIGIDSYCDKKGRFFPKSNQASSVVFCLKQKIKELGVIENTGCEIIGIKPVKNGFKIFQRGCSHTCNRVIISCGGKAYEQSSNTDTGYQIAQSLGHRVSLLKPGLVPIETEGSWPHTLQGIRLDVTLTIPECGLKITDEILWTKYGISGPAALFSSRFVSRNSNINIDFLPYENDIEKKLKKRILLLKNRKASDLFIGFLPDRLGRFLIFVSGIASDLPCEKIKNSDMKRLIKNLKNFEIKIKGLRPFREAQTTCGGVDVSEVRADIMQSKIIPNLFFCGEILDVDADTGGYNLQWAWSSGFVAGNSAGH